MKTILKSTIRNFIRKPAINLINLCGLSVSLALVIILSVYCYSELTTDRFHENNERIFVYGSPREMVYTPGILKEYIDQGVPGVESTVRIAGTWEAPVFQVEDKEPINSDLIFADKDFLKLFTYKTIEGDLENSLNNPMSVVITKSLSEKLFGKNHAVGKIVKLNNDKELFVSAVIEEPKANSCLSFNAITSIATRKIIQPSDGEFSEWGWRNFQTFLLLKKGINPNETLTRILKIIPEQAQKDFAGAGLIPLTKIYFSEFSLFGDSYIKNGDKKQVLILVMVAILVLIVALINFINISSSQWTEKIRQTGVMKVIGAKKPALIFNMVFEAFLFFFSALVFAIFLVVLINPFIHSYTGIHFNPQLIYSPFFVFISCAVVLSLSTLLSLFPAVRISSSKAVDNLKKNVHRRTYKISARSILVAFQFIIAIVLIAFTVLVQKQVNFGSSNLGFNQDNIIGIKMTPQLAGKKEVLKNTLMEKPSVKDIVFTQYYPGKNISQWGTTTELNGDKKHLNFSTFSADAGFFKMMELELVSGRFYSDDLSTDKGKVVVNETFLRQNKLEDPINMKFSMREDRNYEIIGVVKDFHYQAINQPIAPLAIRNDSYGSYCLVNMQTADFNSLHTVFQQIKTEASELSPSFPVEISFFDQAIENMYYSELQFRRTFSLFAVCAIVLCCLGILAMSLFAAQQRIKEIGIRKVNGAKVSEILAMLNKDFVKWVAIAFIIATPLAYYAMNKWLENFAYKTSLSWWIFALAGLLALGIALLTVSFQSWKAATKNPIESLRYE